MTAIQELLDELNQLKAELDNLMFAADFDAVGCEEAITAMEKNYNSILSILTKAGITV